MGGDKSAAAAGRFETGRLIMRPIEMADVDQLVVLDSDPEVMRYLTGGEPTARSEVEAVVHKRLGSRWMAYERETLDFVGWFGAPATGEREYELGYRLVRRYWGKGLATEGTLALIDGLFSARDAVRLWAQTMAVNTRSRRVMERCGLTYVRTFHLSCDNPIEGTEHGEVEYELLRRDWELER
ncbi:MAG TPA: GNAT family N-acetyltransferase [Acidimicrobiales bacterium]|nr:GNAT family N-acetyltransferase [Acidimicrobiales bacterium]